MISPPLSSRAVAAWARSEEVLRIGEERLGDDDENASWEELYEHLTAQELRELRASPCGVCERDVVALGDWYMVHDAVWLEAMPDRSGFLCLSCLEARLGRQLNALDFTDAPVNLPSRASDAVRKRLANVPAIMRRSA